MKEYLSKKKGFLLLVTVLLSITPPLFAEHFHYFVDIETTFGVNESNQLTALEVSWIYDEKMGALMKKQNPNLKSLGTATINDLRKKHYFMNVEFNGKPIKMGLVKHYNLQEFTDNGRKVLQLDFTIPLHQPLKMTGKNKMTWSFADPAGVAIMVYYNQDNIKLGSQLKSHCKATMKENKSAEHGDPAQLLTLECT